MLSNSETVAKFWYAEPNSKFPATDTEWQSRLVVVEVRAEQTAVL